jgi:AcrR family transcriptional regulator
MTTHDQDALLVAFRDRAQMPEAAARILRAALELFAKKGYAATSVREIVQEADVTNPMLYYYFESKEGIFQHLIEFLFSSMRDVIAEAIAAARTLEERIRAIVAVHLSGFEEAPIALQFVYSVIFGPISSRPDFDVIAAHMEMQQMVVGVFEEAIARGELKPQPGFDGVFLAAQLLGLINNHLMKVLKMSEQGPLHKECGASLASELGEEAREKLVQFFLQGAGTLRREV